MAEAVPGTIATLEVRVLKHKPAPRGNNRAPYKVTCEDDTGSIDLVFFHAERKFIERQLPTGAIRTVSGRIESYNDKKQMTHPDYIVAPGGARRPAPAGAGLSADRRPLRQGAAQGRRGRPSSAFPSCPNGRMRPGSSSAAGPTPATALARLHRPGEPPTCRRPRRPGSAWPTTSCWPGQLALALVRQSLKSQPGRSVSGDGRIRARIADALPFGLTGSQRQALKEIAEDMGSAHRMLRLLQGDVGSGKTVVALMAMGVAVEAGAQAALMAPTEVLARQHAETIAPLADAAGLRMALLTGREKGRTRAELLERLAGGDIDILIGTHALFQPDVAFKRPGLRRHRRAAPLRRAPAPRPADQGRQGRRRRAGHDGDADPAHAAHDALRRPRRVEAHREAGRAQADRHQIRFRSTRWNA